jgi:histidine ammonia-lyase
MLKAGLETIKLGPKEGLALINGTQAMTAIGALIIHDAERLLKAADIASAMSLEALKGSVSAFDEKIYMVRPHPGQIACAENLRKLTEESEIIASHKNCDRVQDAYSLRCIPQVHGASRDAISYARKIIETEINSAIDNPLIFEDEIVSCGNFHGQPIALALDFLGMALAEIGNISERRIERLNNPKTSGLPPFLTKKSGLNSGFMVAHYTAASLVSENKILASPASTDSIPVSAGEEDHVSMGMVAARKALKILRNVERIIAIEFLCAAQGLDFHRLKPGIGIAKAHKIIREKIEKLEEDRVMYPDISAATRLIRSGKILSGVEAIIGGLN